MNARSTGPSRRFRSPSVYAWIASTLALVGLLAVYATGRPPDNAVTRIGAETVDSSVGPAADSSKTGLAAFVRRPEPTDLPDVEFNNAEGRKLSLSDFKGKVVLLNLWATWCAPCRKEMPALDRLQKKLGGDRFEVVALSLDRGGVKASQKFLENIGVESLALYVDASGRASKPLRVIGMPTTLLIDANGRELGRLVGEAEWDSPEAVQLIEEALAS